jgi:hypothetical protein
MHRTARKRELSIVKAGKSLALALHPPCMCVDAAAVGVRTHAAVLATDLTYNGCVVHRLQVSRMTCPGCGVTTEHGNETLAVPSPEGRHSFSIVNGSST